MSLRLLQILNRRYERYHIQSERVFLLFLSRFLEINGYYKILSASIHSHQTTAGRYHMLLDDYDFIFSLARCDVDNCPRYITSRHGRKRHEVV